jgi:predicted phage-related endonuclease
MPAQLHTHSEHSFLRASLDGYNLQKKRILEIKCPGKEDHAIALKGKVPEKYIWQLVHQLAVTNADSVDYLSFDGTAGVIVPFERDLKLEKKLLPEEMKFWELVQKKTPPELTERDLMEITDPEDIALFEEMKKAKAIADAADEQVEKFVSQIKKKFPNGQIYCSGYQLIKIFRSGTVDLEKIPQLKGIDLDQYRKPGSFSLTLRPKKAG